MVRLMAIMSSKLNYQFTYHLITKCSSHSLSMYPFGYTTGNRYTLDRFYSVMIDTGASYWSTAGYGQFLAYKSISKNAYMNISNVSPLMYSLV